MRLSRSIFIGLVAIALLLSVGTAFAQGGTINVGDTITQNASNANVDFTLSLSAGDTVTIDVTSDAFDTYLEVIDGSGAIVSFDDDSGDAFNSRLTFTAPTSAAYTLRVRSFAGAANGRFTITVAGGGGSTTTQTGNVINVGDTINASSTSLTEYSLQLAAGQTVTIEALSTVFDTYLELYSGGTMVASDDDGGAVGTNSLLTYTAPTAGTYIVRIRAFGSDNAGGAFTLSVVGSGGGSTTSTQTGTSINVGDTINASSTSLTEYSLQLAAGQTVTIEALSTVFDTYLELYSGGTMVASDDDGGAVGTNSLLTYTAPTAGTYVIRVRAFGSDNAGGAFTLSVAGSGGGSTTTTQTSGAINVGDTVNASATEFADYTVSLASGESIIINLISSEFDSYLVLLDSQGTELATNDDGGDGVNSRLIFTASTAGTYTIRVGSCCVNPPTGSFTLSVAASQVINEIQGGELTYGSSFTFEPNGAITSVFSFAGRAGDTINLNVNSSADEDTRMSVYGPAGSEVASDDDSGPGANPSLRRFELPETGSYTVEVQGYGESPVFEPFVITLERTELLLLNNGTVTLSLNQDIQNDSMAFDVQAGEEYIITITASEKTDASLYIAIQEEGEFYGRTNINYSNIQVVSFMYSVENTGRAQISVDYYAYTEDFVDFTFEVESFTQVAEPTPTPSK